MNYQQTIDFLYSQLPMFQRIGAPAYKADLKNTIAICEILGNPQQQFPSIHIAGTNGKGSVAHMTASVLKQAGYKTGLYTSPHLVDFRERILINGEKIPTRKVIHFVENFKSLFQNLQPSFFEYTFGMAIHYFAEEKIDVAVMEVGMGGRLDSTNVINSIVSVITNIGFDHTQFLGDTLEKIAIEKAGIIKPKIPVIIGETQEEVSALFNEKAYLSQSEIYFADSELSIIPRKTQTEEKACLGFDVAKNGRIYIRNLQTDLKGNYQSKNVVTALKVFELLEKQGFLITLRHIRDGLKNTGLRGRWQILNKSPLTICDTAHNIDGIQQVLNQLNQMPYEQLHFVLGFVNDKDVGHILDLLPQNAIYYFCKANIPRGLDQHLLMEMAVNKKLHGQAYGSVGQAYEAAKKQAKSEDCIFVGGSTFVVAEIMPTSEDINHH